MPEMAIADVGWTPLLDEQFRPWAQRGLLPARVIRQHTSVYAVYAEQGELTAEVSGALLHETGSSAMFPAVGDWVAIHGRHDEGRATIHTVLPRTSTFSRKVAGGRTEEQVVAANVDTVFLVSGLDGDLNLRRIERYLSLAWGSGATPVVVLNKVDVCDDVEAAVADVQSVAVGVPIHIVSATRDQGLDTLTQYLGGQKTVALLGSSGVGKSTLINRFLGTERQRVNAVREDDSHGRHTTTYRELIPLPQGGCVIDTPGMRELQMWIDGDAVARAFDDVERLAGQCRFRDCKHQHEPGCAVKTALKDGTLDGGRYRNYLKLQRELRYLDTRLDQKARSMEEAKWRKIAINSRKRKRAMRRGGYR
jgi:ribosome biogenesis GTPase